MQRCSTYSDPLPEGDGPYALDRVNPVVPPARLCDDRRYELQPALRLVQVNGTILIVDDHDGFRLSVRRMLEREGYVVVGEAINGRSAITEAERLRPTSH